jgi:hypothetical protein
LSLIEKPPPTIINSTPSFSFNTSTPSFASHTQAFPALFSFNTNTSTNLAPSFTPFADSSNNLKIKQVIQTVVLEMEIDKFCVIVKFKQENRFFFQIKSFSIDNVLTNEITKKTSIGNMFKAFVFQRNNVFILERHDTSKFSVEVYDSELKECETKNFNLSSTIFVPSPHKMFSPTLIVQTIPDYSVIVSKCRFYILRKKNESSVAQLAAINEKIEIEREDNVSVEVFNPGNSFIESDKLFTFERNKLNIYD